MRSLFGVLVLSLVTLNSCAGRFGFDGTSWQEEVLLHDGNKLIVERSVSRGGPREIGQRGSYTKETLAFKHPASGEIITWEDNATPDLRNSNFLPMALDVYPDAAYLVVSPMGCFSYNKWGRPNPPYVVFRFGVKTWSRVDLSELPAETKAPNMIFSSPDTEVERLGMRFVDAETIKRINDEHRRPEYKAILRKGSPSASEQCRVEYSNGMGTWLSADWFSDNKDLASCMVVCDRKGFDKATCPCSQFFK